jgi:Tol biopolymer transport system component
MTHRRWIVAVILTALICLVAGGLGAVLLVKNIPAAARLVFGESRRRATSDLSSGVSLPGLATVTLTPMPTQPQPTVAPSETPVALPSPLATGTDEPTAEVPPTTTSTPTPTLPPPTPPPPQWIAFETVRGDLGDYEIFVMATDGSRLANLTNCWADDVAPVWSPDGRHIAFVSLRDTLTGKWGMGTSSIYIIDFDPVAGVSRGEARRLTDDGGSDGWPTWSPDGQRIAFHSDRGGDWDIWVINVDGTGLTNLTRQPGDDQYADWSPDGKKIAFTSSRSGNQDIWVMSVPGPQAGGDGRGTDLVNLTNAKGRDRYPMWSPDGTRLTFNTNRDGDYEVYMMKADGSNQRNISDSPKSTEGLADWSPDGQRLVLYSSRPGNKDVFIVDLTTGVWTNITNDPASDEFCTWSP